MSRAGDGARGKVAFVYANSRRLLAAEVAAGTAPDSTLLGQDHLAALGYETFVHEPRIKAVSEDGGLAHRVRWNMREIMVPWELGDANFVVTPLANLLPASARLRPRLHTVLFDFALATTLDRRHGASHRLLTASLRSASAIVCLSENQRTRLLERIDLPADRLYVIPLGIDADFLRPSERQSDPNGGYVLAVGKDLARDYRTLAGAAARVDARFVIVTEERNIRGIELPSNVEVRNGLTHAELRELYAGAGCTVLPLRRPGYAYGTESGGLTALLEAMAMAKPLVASDRPVIREYVDAGESALVVPAEDADALAAAVTRLLLNDTLASTLGAAARRRVEERHTTRHFASGLAEVFTGLS